LIEVAYHDNPEDENWITGNIDAIASAIASAVNEYFTAPVEKNGQTAKATLTSGYLNIRSGPALNAPVVGMAPNGATLKVIEKAGDWYNVEYNGVTGYANADYLTMQ